MKRRRPLIGYQSIFLWKSRIVRKQKKQMNIVPDNAIDGLQWNFDEYPQENS